MNTMLSELNHIIDEENLKPEATKRLMIKAFQNGSLHRGIELSKCLPPIDMFRKDKLRTITKNRVYQKLSQLLINHWKE